MWLLDTSCLKELEAFQHKIGCRILRVPKFYSAVAVRVALHWPGTSTLILLRKLNYLCKLLALEKDTISQRMFNSIVIKNAYDCSIAQQCRMLEAQLGTTVLGDCLSNPTDAIQIVKDNKELILKTDFSKLLATASRSASLAASIGNRVSWRHLWDMALDKGVKETKSLQNLFCELCCPASCFMCTQYESHPSTEYICSSHSNMVHNLSIDKLVSTLTDLEGSERRLRQKVLVCARIFKGHSLIP